MQDVPIWKPILIVVVLGLCGLSLYPPSQKLKPGLDLAGGTTLVYQVDVPADQEAKSVIEQVIETLKKRVDPNGVKNLVWRRQAGNRIEIQIPLPPAETTQRRANYLSLRDKLFIANIKKRELDSALRAAPASRSAVLARLAGDETHRLEQLEALAEAYDHLAAAREPYQETQRKLEELEESIAQLPAGQVAHRREEILGAVREDLLAKTRAYLDACGAFEEAQAAVLATNIDPNEFELILGLPEEVKGGSKTKNPDRDQRTRSAALKELTNTHPDRTDQIMAVAQAKGLYDEIRGALDDPNDLIDLLRGAGVLEFRIAPGPDQPGVKEYRERLRERGPKAGISKPFRWFVIDDLGRFAEKASDREALEEDPIGYFAQRRLVGQPHGEGYYILLANTPDRSITRSHEDWKLVKAVSRSDDSGFLAVGFELNRVGGQLMGDLTGNNLKKPMAIVLDGRVISTPSINSRIQDQGIITGGRGGFGQDEQRYLIRTLNAGSLQGRLSEDPIYIKTFGPQLGQDNLRSGLKAAVWALIVVVVFMAVYYLFGGVVAGFALAANMLIILGVMALFDATFTLPGIAGIVLTIGMAVDANVLIFERIREELENKADVRTAVRLGYEKALSTIIDANLTTLIICVILNYTATAEIKGFAITLMIGIIATMFTALFCTRVIVDAYLHLAKPKTLLMLPNIVAPIGRLLRPNFNWVGKRYLFFCLSAVLVVSGISLVVERGQKMLDIEFRSGTQVGFELAQDKTLTLDDVRKRLTRAAEEHGIADLAGDRATVVTVGDVQGDRAHEFSVATLEENAGRVSKAIKAAFADVLDIQRPIDFKGMGDRRDAPPVNLAPVYTIRSATLGEDINRPEVQTNVSDYLGGVAVVLEGMNPAPTLTQLTDRIQRMRMSPGKDRSELGYRPFTVIGLDLAPSADGRDIRYRSAVVVVSEADTNYIDMPDTFADAAGLAATEWTLIRDALQRDTSLGSVANFSSQISNTMKLQAIVAMGLSLLAVVLYIWLRFGSLRYSFAAIIALVHDVAIAMGLVALAGQLYDTPLGQGLLLSDFKINLALVAAVLTIVGYSLNDTIVVFDRIRENRGRLASATVGIVNDSINQTISRTVITSVTTLMALFTLYLYGGPGVHGFAFTMLVGVLVGTYSSVAIAAPILLIGVRDKSKETAGS